jgi:hypothetical protein
VQGAPRSVERVGIAAPVPAGGQLDPAPALIEGVAGQPDHVEGIHHRHRVGQCFSGGGLEPGKAIHGLLDMVEGRSKQAFGQWLTDRPKEWRDRVEIVTAAKE